MQKAVLYPCIFFFAAIFNSCTNNITDAKLVKNTAEGYAQGTTYYITYLTKKPVSYQIQIDSILQKFDLSLSTYIDSSIVSQINQNIDVTVDSLFKTVFNRSQQISELTFGSFDITISPIINYYGFGYKEKSEFNLDSNKVTDILKHTGYKKVQLINDKILKDDSLTTLSFNAIAQGYSVDVVCDFLESKGVRNYMVEIGGELRVTGNNPDGKLWRIGIDKPIENNTSRELQTIIELKDKALATSGNYRKFYTENGIKFSHTINPSTGYPAKNKLLSATVIANNCMDADAYATAFMVMGLAESKAFLNKHPELSAYLIYSGNSKGFEVFSTDSMQY